MPIRRPTLKDVSSEAGVSLYTASRAMSGHAGVAKETQARVRETAAALGYVANQHARSLKGIGSGVIGVIAASKANQYYATLVGALEDAVEPHGYSCFVADAVMNGIYLPEREDRIVESMIQQRVAAVVVTYAIDARNLALLDDWQIPVLFVDALPSEPSHPSVSTDNFSGGLVMGDHLRSLGYRRWCFVGHARNWNTREPRQRGFEAAAASCGATVDVVEGGNDAEVARCGVTALLTRSSNGDRPHVLFASNTVLLKGALLALNDCGIEIPTGMAVVAFDDFDWAELIAPPVTVIDQHIALIGRTAGSQVLGMLGEIQGAGGLPEAVSIAPTLRVRESCGSRLAPERRPGSGRTAVPEEKTSGGTRYHRREHAGARVE